MTRNWKRLSGCILLTIGWSTAVYATGKEGPRAVASSRTLAGNASLSGARASSDAGVSAPAGVAPCVVNLFANYVFRDYSAQYFNYTPTCQGPWSKVVFKGNFNVSAGVQFDRTANIQLGFVNLYFGTTEEPSPTSAPSWSVQRDLTDYSSLFTTAQSGEVDIYNIVSPPYTGIIYGNAWLEFYPVANGATPPVTADVVYPLPNGPGAPYHLGSGTDQLSATFTLPTNIEQAYLDVVSQGQQGDEFWYTCVPNDVAGELFSCGNTAFRETEISIDGQPAGVAPVFPWIFTGGIDPYLWIPITGVQTLNFVPYRVNLTPFAGMLNDGQPHTIALSVFNANNYFQSVASLLVYLDHGSTHVTGMVTGNTLAAPNPLVQENLSVDGSGNITGTVDVKSSHQFTISGFVNTSHGTVNTSITETETFNNLQNFDITSSVYQQEITQATTVNAQTTTISNSGTSVVTNQFNFPLIVNIAQTPNAQGLQQVTSISQTYANKNPAGSLVQTVKTTDTLQFDSGFNLLGNSNQSSSNETTTVSGGKCTSVLVTAANNVGTGKQAGGGCQ